MCVYYDGQVTLDLPTNKGETPLFVTIKSNQLPYMQQLINSGSNMSNVDNRWATYSSVFSN